MTSKVLYGITHDVEGLPIIREPRILKVSIGYPKGPAIDVGIYQDRWFVRTGYKQGAQRAVQCKDRADAELKYAEMKPQAPVCPFPRKLSYFTFTRQVADGTFEPDFEAIEAHGERPNHIDLVFLDDDPLDAAYQMWGASELKCKGNGLDAERVLSMAHGEAQTELARIAAGNGLRHFPITGGCCLRGCPFALETTHGGKVLPAACKPHADLKFQLAKNIRLGGTAYFTTTGRRSISQLFSSLYRFRKVTGGGDPERGFLAGIPFQMALKPFRTMHNGQAGTAYAVVLEFRSDSVENLVKNMHEQASRLHRLAVDARTDMTGERAAVVAPVRQQAAIAAAPEPDSAIPAELIDPGEDEVLAARAFGDEFIDEGDDTPEPSSTPAETATVGGTLKDRVLAAAAPDQTSLGPQQQSVNHLPEPSQQTTLPASRPASVAARPADLSTISQHEDAAMAPGNGGDPVGTTPQPGSASPDLSSSRKTAAWPEGVPYPLPHLKEWPVDAEDGWYHISDTWYERRNGENKARFKDDPIPAPEDKPAAFQFGGGRRRK